MTDLAREATALALALRAWRIALDDRGAFASKGAYARCAQRHAVELAPFVAVIPYTYADPAVRAARRSL